MVIFLATANEHKVLEINRFLSARYSHIKVKSAVALGGMPEVDETEDSFVGNALLKGKSLWEKKRNEVWVLADDSGISFDALDGKPGIFSARYAGLPCDDQANNNKVLRELEGVPFEKRTAYYTCALALISPEGEEYIFEEKCYGRFLNEAKGKNGFGYDPYFVPDGYCETFGQLSPEVKDQISHRAKALEKLADFLSLE